MLSGVHVFAHRVDIETPEGTGKDLDGYVGVLVVSTSSIACLNEHCIDTRRLECKSLIPVNAVVAATCTLHYGEDIRSKLGKGLMGSLYSQ